MAILGSGPALPSPATLLSLRFGEQPDRSQRAPRIRVVVPGGRGPGASRCERLRAVCGGTPLLVPSSGSPLEDAPHERGCAPYISDAICSQAQNELKVLPQPELRNQSESKSLGDRRSDAAVLCLTGIPGICRLAIRIYKLRCWDRRRESSSCSSERPASLNRDAFISNHKLASLPGFDPAIHPVSKDFLRSRWMRGSSPRLSGTVCA